MEKETRIPYAWKDGRMVEVDDVPRGRKCGCICIKCGQPVEARQGEERHYFAHYNAEHQCVGAYEAAIYALAVQVLMDAEQVMAPAYKNVVPAGSIHFKHVEADLRAWGVSIKPDIIGTCEDGTIICIGLRCASESDDKKISRLVEESLHCMEIDIHDCPSGELELRKFLLESVESRKWLKHPEYERVYQQRLREKEERRGKEEVEREQQRNRAFKRMGVSLSEQPPRWPDANKADIPETEHERRKQPEETKVTKRLVPLPLQDGPIKEYYETLHPHAVFAEYTEAHTVVVNFGLSYSRRAIYVIHVNQPYKGVRFPFHLSRITYGENGYEHEHIGAYQTEQLAEWRQIKLQEDL